MGRGPETLFSLGRPPSRPPQVAHSARALCQGAAPGGARARSRSDKGALIGPGPVPQGAQRPEGRPPRRRRLGRATAQTRGCGDEAPHPGPVPRPPRPPPGAPGPVRPRGRGRSRSNRHGGRRPRCFPRPVASPGVESQGELRGPKCLQEIEFLSASRWKTPTPGTFWWGKRGTIGALLNSLTCP